MSPGPSTTRVVMNLNSQLFDKIRASGRRSKVATTAPEPQRCDHAGCKKPGDHRAPMGRDREGQFFCFCLEHVRAYNASYNYFNGMTDEDVASYQKDAHVGHRPTWSMGANRGARGHREEGVDPANMADPLGMFGGRAQPLPLKPREPRHGIAAMKSLAVLGLDDSADKPMINARYKELVKRLHPDANAGDRSNEERLRQIIQAYKHLKASKIA